MTTLTARDRMLAWAFASKIYRHSLRATCAVIELDAKGRVMSARQVWL
jgi:hypothetical protein